MAPTGPVVIPNIKKADDAWMSWQRSKQDTEKYPILQNNRDYTDWSINIKRQFDADRCTRMIDDSSKKTMVTFGPANTELYKAQHNHMPIVLEHILQTTNGKWFTRKHKDTPCGI